MSTAALFRPRRLPPGGPRLHGPARPPQRGRRGEHGFGLVEMMVSLVLGLLVVGAAAMVFVGARQANTATNSLSRVQEAVRASHDLMSREVREAGATPCDAQMPRLANVLNGAQLATPPWWAAWGNPVEGSDGAAAFAPVADGTGVGQRVAGTDALIVRYGQTLDGVAVATHAPAAARFTAGRANPGIVAGDHLLVCNYRVGAIFNVTAVNDAAGTFDHAAGAGNAANCSAGLGTPVVCSATGTALQFGAGALVSRLVAAGWYVGNNGRAAGGGRSLYRVTRNGSEEVAEGVREMQITYLVEGAADYVAAGAVTNWSAVVAVRFDLVYEGPDAGTSTAVAGGRLTRNVGFTINLRNLQSWRRPAAPPPRAAPAASAASRWPSAWCCWWW